MKSKSPKLYKPDRGIRDYSGKIFTEQSIITIMRNRYFPLFLFLCTMFVIVVFDVFLDFDKLGISVVVYMLTAFALGIIQLGFTYKCLIRYRAAIESGGYVHSERTQKRYRNSQRYFIIAVVLELIIVLGCAALLLLIGPVKLSESSAWFYLPLITYQITNLANLDAGAYTPGMLVFCDDRYISNGFSVPYERITSVVQGEKTQYNNAVIVKITVYSGVEQVGHDIMYEADYYHLYGILAAFQQYPAVNAGCDVGLTFSQGT